jgi:hypothetical protein
MTPIETPVGTLYEIPASGVVAVSFDRNLSEAELQALRDNWRALSVGFPKLPRLIVLPKGARVCPPEMEPVA